MSHLDEQVLVIPGSEGLDLHSYLCDSSPCERRDCGNDTEERLPWLRSAERWWYILRYHKKTQIARRILKTGKQLAMRVTGMQPFLSAAPQIYLRDCVDFRLLLNRKIQHRTAALHSSRINELMEGRFCFLNHTVELPDPINWRVAIRQEVSHLWRFQLHYHEYLMDMAAAYATDEDVRYLSRAWQIVEQWIENNSLTDANVLNDAWHPYCISRRIPIWILLWSASPNTCDDAERFHQSLHQQASFLERNLEWDLCGNHLLENLKALLMCGIFFEGKDAERWKARGEQSLRQQIREQILPTGEHFERSPMYHCHVTELLLDLADCTARVNPELSALCKRTSEEMAGFLQQIVHPDGEIPLLSDSCFGETAPASRLTESIAEADREQAASVSHKVGDYWVHSDGGDFLLFDAGPTGADQLPAHAHCDLLNIEASIGGQRLFVDSGVFNYEDDEMRAYCRSTAAHNVLEIDGMNQCDVWSRFRMGYRGRPTRFESGIQNGFNWVVASHNAYRRIRVPTVRRWLACRSGGPWFCVDSVVGKGNHTLTNRLHLHPEAYATQTGAVEIMILLDKSNIRLKFLVPGHVTIGSSWYCPEFGKRQTNQVIIWSATTPLPATCVWQLTWDDGEHKFGTLPFGEFAD